ncbi:uncharacterized protein LOC129744315 [Uranotaenia lowii]|uniref:uncharacterized protein LOC129744315 n=1 Tax=Uranotaenia lowii TaxID=190385 RepID=UPI002478D8F9|nr:uncharacterized protein LOC129744315 [Uranotaenia lowii]XP_055592765.1 uncharacterized protein LOC129744315 [Uranotaenia lowii]XP_055592766.1 uncharacterized protein LOC129744315 [Uranotaenia lowii]XP_055592767.1 uncharacterized protein LOC129744315 [Uranotaenia lowii]XP_055592768.1 uncharacterized protein LOC129744315 [Uranotaenia lowii]XP_055592769.1 uncharacterized protein LOC129744315 [Uranotaenia lowii]
MKQIAVETEDPLKRIQEEINEVARREQELRQSQRLTDSNDDCLSSANSDDSGLSLSPSPVHSPSVSNLKDKIEARNNGTPPISTSNGHLRHHQATMANGNHQHQQQFIAPQSPSPVVAPSASPPSKALTRARSTPQLFQISPSNRRFNVNPNQRGIMQKFIASRGRLNKMQSTPTTTPNGSAGAAINNNGMGSNGNLSVFGTGTGQINTDYAIKHEQHVSSIELRHSNLMIPPTAISAPPTIERDSNGKPIRRGYVPVEEKIQKELRDLKSRESELKRLRKHRVASQSDLLEYQDCNSDSGEELSDEGHAEDHIFPLSRKLRSAKSIGELCDALTSSSLSPRETPSPQFDNRSRIGGMRPAMSLAQLCDLDPEEAPSSHKLIAQWENIIQQKQQR